MIEIKNCDCLELLKSIEDKSVDLVLIDPPYGVSRSTNFSSGSPTGRDVDRFRISYEFGDWDNSFDHMDKVISECYRVLKNGGTIVCFYDIWKIQSLREYMEASNFKQLRFIEYLKSNPVPINSKINYLSNCREAAVVAVKGSKPTFNSEYDNGVYVYPLCHDKGRFHTTQKPLKLIEELVKKHSNKGDLVLDCFSGSGTTAVACKNLDRRFIGCEINKDYFDKSIERLNNAGVY